MHRLFARLFGWKYALLIHFDGKVSKTRVRHIGNGRIYGKVYGRKVFLLDGGDIAGCSYIDAWEPLDYWRVSD